MTPEHLTAAVGAASGVTNHWGLLGLFVFCAFAVFALWLLKVSGDSKKLVAKSDELEKERTENRGIERDHKMVEQENRIMAVVNAVKNDFKQHIDTHKESDSRIQAAVSNLSSELRSIQNSMVKDVDFTRTQCEMKTDIKNMENTIRKMENVMTIIQTILEEREKRERLAS